MSFHIRIFIVLILLISNQIIIQAKEIEYNHNSITIEEIREKVDFKVLVPQNIPKKWTLEIKTYPKSGEINNFRLHLMDDNDQELMVGIHEKRSAEQITSNPRAEKVNINGLTAYFREWGNEPKGGLLTWVQDGTYIEMDSHRISKEQMIKIARSIK